ncbi:MAG TPA: CDP-diacylglycerol--glycerol-3-phosphate 3-phosphatidyltransferase [Defluviitoga tunisiensis]|nr:CDP-diacylglycerol--glycerol-3-phosphate 3-phosphatidyltransferase [Defluviitoga tunisiensis]HOK16317.1 CDP-diacylglycerol--glycerol-3-phosphate 3-phosphatidyltransferase [Defluviitoga tunisiensis]HOL86551.1 CDP-diacylglycerol--glycerol-3-phosphate 3-phosphatidyltransferase [Defluviitoga tunisiensis]HPP10127.1 CDP-diacylglycerol--glycerol-3-phosphate 3-phosphatidyltransferase [Defluviitoga tunisiensis]
MNIPNLLSLSRIFLAIPVFILTALGKKYFIAALIVFIVASLTDLFDGLIARKKGQVTDLGKFLDQISDKILINSTFIALLTIGNIPGWFVALIVGRDTYVSGLRMFLASKDIIIPADILGKIKTVLEIVLIVLIYLQLWNILSNILLYLTLIISLVSAANYTIKNLKAFTEA